MNVTYAFFLHNYAEKNRWYTTVKKLLAEGDNWR